MDKSIQMIQTPLDPQQLKILKAGDKVLITGNIYTARDAAHRRLCDLIEKGEEIPIDLKNQIIYYVGPTPAKPGHVIGPAGPTTSSRMDSLTLPLLQKGLKGMIGKGKRSKEVIEGMKEYKAVYFAATGGAAALISKRIKKSEIVAYDDLGSEAIYKLYVEDFPAIVVIDTEGNNLYETEPDKYKILT